MACNACTGVLQRRERLYDRTSLSFDGDEVTINACLHHASAHELDAAAVSGCAMCAALWGTFTTSQQQILLSADTSRPALATEIPPLDDDSRRAYLSRTKLTCEWFTYVTVELHAPGWWPPDASGMRLWIDGDNLCPLELEDDSKPCSEVTVDFCLSAQTLEARKAHFNLRA